jgi:ribose/xylose/arabinose/galactoside ABC-type transport system permease subunit
MWVRRIVGWTMEDRQPVIHRQRLAVHAAAGPVPGGGPGLHHGLDLVAAMLLALDSRLVVAMVNGLRVGHGGLNPFITTLATGTPAAG